jgi:hypothetical protein
VNDIEQLRRGWRSHAADITDEEILTLSEIGLEGSKAAAAVRILRAARAELPEWTCPGCGTVTRARMADASTRSDRK